MHILTRCPECSAEYRLSHTQTGREARCRCGRTFVVQPCEADSRVLAVSRKAEKSANISKIIRMCPTCHRKITFRNQWEEVLCPDCGTGITCDKAKTGLWNPPQESTPVSDVDVNLVGFEDAGSSRQVDALLDEMATKERAVSRYDPAQARVMLDVEVATLELKIRAVKGRLDPCDDEIKQLAATATQLYEERRERQAQAVEVVTPGHVGCSFGDAAMGIALASVFGVPGLAAGFAVMRANMRSAEATNVIVRKIQPSEEEIHARKALAELESVVAPLRQRLGEMESRRNILQSLQRSSGAIPHLLMTVGPGLLSGLAALGVSLISLILYAVSVPVAFVIAGVSLLAVIGVYTTWLKPLFAVALEYPVFPIPERPYAHRGHYPLLVAAILFLAAFPAMGGLVYSLGSSTPVGYAGRGTSSSTATTVPTGHDAPAAYVRHSPETPVQEKWKEFVDRGGRFSCTMPPAWTSEQLESGSRSKVKFIHEQTQIHVIVRPTQVQVVQEQDLHELENAAKELADRIGASSYTVDHNRIRKANGVNAADFAGKIVRDRTRLAWNSVKFKKDGNDHTVTFFSYNGSLDGYTDLFERFIESYRSTPKATQGK